MRRGGPSLFTLQSILAFLILLLFLYANWAYHYIKEHSNQPVEFQRPNRPKPQPIQWTLPSKLIGFTQALHGDLGYHTSNNAVSFYATHRDHICSILINIDRLISLGMDESISLLLLVPESLNDKWLQDSVGIYNINVISFNETLPSNVPGNHIKLLLFNLTQFNKILHLDYDMLVMKSIDHLFLLPNKINIAAPRTYWTGSPKRFTTSFMLIEPSKKSWNLIESKLVESTNDLDIYNDVFLKECLLLPSHYMILDEVWKDVNNSKLDGTGEGDLDSLAHSTLTIHFTFSKPWNITRQDLMKMAPNHHRFLMIIYDLWWSGRDRVC